MKISTNPPKGTYDRYPDEFAIRDYIFGVWKKVCMSFGYQQYLGPLVENSEIWKAKSGEDVGGSELTMLTDRDGKISELALRPEMTPSVTRMVAKIYNQTVKPVRYFSIANFYRNEKPQRGRNREFRQLNVDMFGDTSTNSDIEILQVVVEIMKAFAPPVNSWKVSLNHRKLIDFVLVSMGMSEDFKIEVVRLMDKRNKLSAEDMHQSLSKIGLDDGQITKLTIYMNTKNLSDLIAVFDGIQDNIGFQELQKIIQNMAFLGNLNVNFDSTVIRGFDYYDGFVFEVQDLNPDNRRAMFGGGRYNGLGGVFGINDMSAVGFAPGDESMKLFLEGRGMIDDIQKKLKNEIFYVPILDQNLELDYSVIASKLRQEGKSVISGLELEKMGKSIEKAGKLGCQYCVIYGENEKMSDNFIIKNLSDGSQEKVKI